MAIDRKYGRVTLELGDVGTNEPVVVFRADDGLLPELLLIYIDMCRNAGRPEQLIADFVVARDDVLEWQETHSTAGGRHHLRARDGD